MTPIQEKVDWNGHPAYQADVDSRVAEKVNTVHLGN
jgi:hypothetical protein